MLFYLGFLAASAGLLYGDGVALALGICVMLIAAVRAQR